MTWLMWMDIRSFVLSTVRGGLVPANRLLVNAAIYLINQICPYLSLSSLLVAQQACSVAAGVVSVVVAVAAAVSAAAVAPSGHS